MQVAFFLICLEYLKIMIIMLAIIIKPHLHLLPNLLEEVSNSKQNIPMRAEMFELGGLCVWNGGCTWVWNKGEGLGFMGSTSIGHYKDSHRNRRSDGLVVERRDCHYQMVLEKDPKGQLHFYQNVMNSMVYQSRQVWHCSLYYSRRNRRVYGALICIYLMEKVHINLCLSLPGIII